MTFNPNKIRYELAPPEFDDIILPLQHSADTGKYKENGWLEGVDFKPEKNMASIKRHLKEYVEGKRVDDDNGLHPLLMAGLRCMMQYTLDKRADHRTPEQKTEDKLNPDLTDCTRCPTAGNLKDLNQKITIYEHREGEDCKIAGCHRCYQEFTKRQYGIKNGGSKLFDEDNDDDNRE